MMKLIHVHGYGNVGGAADWNLVVKVVLSLSNKLIASKQTELYLDKNFGLKQPYGCISVYAKFFQMNIIIFSERNKLVYCMR